VWGEETMYMYQQTLEKESMMILSDEFLFKSEEGPRCAWCLCEQGLELGNGSHGICPQHATWLLQQYRERNARRHHLREKTSV
jgi:hypothetical protein